ncbi:helix-turn-helix domain-containing protein [Streptomyces sp. NPDC002845]
MPSRPSPPLGLIYVHDTDDGPGIATRLGVRPGTIRTWRNQGRGPRTWRLNGRIVSSIADIEKYLAAQANATARGAA